MLCTHTFSPNWYRPQCLLFCTDSLVYASNYTLYLYGLPERKVLRDACLRRLALSNNMDSKNIKILSIVHLGGSMLLVGTNQPYLVVFCMDRWECSQILDLRSYGVKSVCLMHVCGTMEMDMEIDNKINNKMEMEMRQCSTVILVDEDNTLNRLSHILTE